MNLLKYPLQLIVKIINPINVIFFNLYNLFVFFSLATNVLGLGEEGELVVQMLNLFQMPNRSTMFKVCTSAPFLPNPCYRLFFFGRFEKCQIIKQLNKNKK
jgi:hypothetical protein